VKKSWLPAHRDFVNGGILHSGLTREETVSLPLRCSSTCPLIRCQCCLPVSWQLSS